MSERQINPLSSQVDVSPTVVASSTPPILSNESVLRLLHSILQVQQQQLDLTREMVVLARETRQRQQAELESWQRDNPGIVGRCRNVLDTLNQTHAGMLGDMAEHISENRETLLESDFAVSEFVDRFGPRLHHLSAMLGVLRQVTATTRSNSGEDRTSRS